MTINRRGEQWLIFPPKAARVSANPGWIFPTNVQMQRMRWNYWNQRKIILLVTCCLLSHLLPISRCHCRYLHEIFAVLDKAILLDLFSAPKIMRHLYYNSRHSKSLHLGNKFHLLCFCASKGPHVTFICSLLTYNAIISTCKIISFYLSLNVWHLWVL